VRRDGGTGIIRAHRKAVSRVRYTESHPKRHLQFLWQCHAGVGGLMDKQLNLMDSIIKVMTIG